MERAIFTGPAQAGEVDGHRFGESEHHPPAGPNQKERRQKDGAERIDMLERVEGDPAQALCRVVAKPPGDPAVCRFVEGDGDQDRQDPDGNREADLLPIEIKH